jgi:hypothetical protein
MSYVGKIGRGRVLIGNNVREARSSVAAGCCCEKELEIADFDVENIDSISVMIFHHPRMASTHTHPLPIILP